MTGQPSGRRKAATSSSVVSVAIYSPPVERVYIANEDDSLVTVIDRKSGDVVAEVPVGVEPEGMRVSPDNKITVATSESSSMAHFIDNEKDEVIANVLVDTRPRHAEWTRDGSQVWVSSEVGGTVSVIDGKTHEIAKVINFAIPGVSADLIQPVGIRFSKDGKLAFVALGPPTASPWSMPTPTTLRTTSWSASAPGTWRSIPTGRSSTSPTARPTT